MPEVEMPSDEEVMGELHIALQVMTGAVNARLKLPIADGAAWENDAQVLAIKLFRHLHSVTRLYEEGRFSIGDGQEVAFVDHSSAAVLTRAALETLLVFSYVYGDPDPEVCKFRHAAWKLGGLADRQAFAAISDATRNKQAVEKVTMEELRAQLEGSPVMATFSEKQRPVILKGRWDGIVEMWQLGVGAGIHEKFFRTLYKSVSTHAHTAWSGVLQVRDSSKSIDEQRELAGGSVSTCLFIAALFVEGYCSVFSTGRDYLAQRPPEADFIGVWAQIARGVGDLYDRGGIA